MAVKLSKLHYSQNAHEKLRRKALQIPGKKGDIKYHYHNEILIRQRAQNRIFNKSERKKIYNSVVEIINKT